MHKSLFGPSKGGKPRHTSVLLEEIELAAAASGGWLAVDQIAVGLGPGSFTGVRIGIAVARGLALSTGLPTAGVCTLDAVGRALGTGAGDGRGSLAVLDARRGEIFAALYSARGERLWEPLVLSPAELAARVGKLSPRLGPRDRERYDFAKSWTDTALRYPTMTIPCTASPRGRSALSRQPGRHEGMACSNRFI